MNTVLRYYGYHFKRTLIRIIVLVIFISLMAYYSSCSNWASPEYAYVEFTATTVVLIIIAYILAAMELYPFKNRRNLDLWLSSPLSRTKLIVTHIVNGAVHLFITTLFAGIFATARIAVMNTMLTRFNTISGLRYAAVIFPSLLITYIVACAIYIIGNNGTDGVIFLIMYTLLPVLVNGAIEYFSDNFRIDTDFQSLAYLSWLELPLALTVDEERIAMNKPAIMINSGRDMAALVVSSVVWGLIAVALLVLIAVYFRKLKPEKIGGPSDIFPGYRFLIPSCGYSMLIISADSYIVVPLFILIGMFLMYIVFRKGIRIKIPDIVCLGVGVVIMILMRVIAPL
ncbi:MAG: hypothetical protein J6Z43_01135 [Clostridiales bacterium]|nr:hypothetical protein [Clostridiales bacterium]